MTTSISVDVQAPARAPRRAAAVLATIALAVGGITVVPPTAQAANLPNGCTAEGECETVFSFDNSQKLRRWTPPVGATDFTFDLYGGSGFSTGSLPGGSGGAMRTSALAPAAGTEFAIVVGEGGQTSSGGYGGGGAGGNGSNVSSRGFAGGGGTFVFMKTPDASWQPLAVVGGGGGTGGGNLAGQRGGGNGAEGEPVNLNGGSTGCPNNTGATPTFRGTTQGCMNNLTLGSLAWGPAAYSGGLEVDFGQGGNAVAGTNGGLHGGGGGGGYYGGYAGSSGSNSAGTGYSGGGGSGYLGAGLTATALAPVFPPAWASVNGSVTIRYRLATDSTSMTLSAAPTEATYGQQTRLTATVECHYGVDGTVTFLDGDEQIGTAELEQTPSDGERATAQAGLSYTPDSAGTHHLTASWEGGELCTASEAGFELSVAPLQFPNVPLPKVSGTTKVGAVLTAIQGAWETQPQRLGYQWLRDDRAIVGATGRSYLLVAADVGRRISVTVEATKPNYETATARSASTGIIAKGQLVTSSPRVSGTHRVGKRLTVKVGSWAPQGVGVKVQWLRNGKAIKGATKTTYKLAGADKRKRISVRITGTLPGYATMVKVTKAKKVQ